MVDTATGIVAICIVLATTATTAGTIITGGITIINHLRDRASPPVKRGVRAVACGTDFDSGEKYDKKGWRNPRRRRAARSVIENEICHAGAAR